MTRFISIYLALCACVIVSTSASAKQYTVQEGDTISGILAKGALTLADLEQANPGKKNWPDVLVGEVLETPYLSPVEVRVLEAKQAVLQEDLKRAHESISELMGERDSARKESISWQSKYEVAKPIVQSATLLQKVFWNSVVVFGIILAAFLVYIWSLRGLLRIECEAKDRFRHDVDRQKQEILVLQRADSRQPSPVRVSVSDLKPRAARTGASLKV